MGQRNLRLVLRFLLTVFIGSVISANNTVYAQVIVQGTVPGAPTIGTATAGDTTASIAFAAPSSDGNLTITSYTATSNPGRITGTCSSSPCIISGLTNGTAYTFTVTATNALGSGSASNTSNSVIPTGSQTISFTSTAPTSAAVGGSTYTPTATATSELAVAFTIDSSSSAVCSISSGVVSFTGAGTCLINANQAGNATYNAATQVQQSFAVGKQSTTVSLSTTTPSRILGQSLTLTTTVAPASCTGTVTFKDGSTTLGTGTLSSGSASFSTTSLTAGSHSLTAEYGGDSNCLSSTSSAVTVTVTITKPTTTIALTASSTSVLFGQSVTFSATVSPNAATGTVTFKEGSTTLGTGTLSSGVATFATSSLATGSHSVIAVYGGDSIYLGSTSSAVSIAVTRPNPAADPRVRGIVNSQHSTVVRTVQTTTQQVNLRLETLHDDDVPAFSNGISVSGSNSCSAPGGVTFFAQPDPRRVQACGGYAGMMAYMMPDQLDGNRRERMSPAMRSIERQMEAFHKKGAKDKQKSGSSLEKNNLFNVWTAGSIMIGYDPQSTSPNKVKVKMSGITVGVDTKLRSNLKAGVAFTFSSDQTDIGTDGTRSKGQSLTGTVYASWKVFDHVFVDGLVGYGGTRLSSRRFDDNANGFIYGVRNAKTLFGSITLSYDKKYGAWRVSPYGRLDAIMAQLDPYTETGDANWILSFQRARMVSYSGVAGLRSQYDIEMSWGTLSPTLRVEYRHMFGGNLTQVMSYAADPSTTYSLLQQGTARDTIMGTIGLQARNKAGVSGGVEYMLTSSQHGIQSQGLRGSLRVPF
jgi:uncharacterized protein YhjY with autotransporter beta-barrel domain